MRESMHAFLGSSLSKQTHLMWGRALNGLQVLESCYSKGTHFACLLQSSGSPFHIVVFK
jgi:predicted alpha/beta superfamily hydrolase